VIASGRSLTDLNLQAFSQDEAELLVVESMEIAAVTIESITLFKQQNPTGRVAVLGRHRRPSEIAAAFQAGANVYLSEVAASDEFVKALEVVMMGQTILPMELLSWITGTEGDREVDEVPAEPQGESADGGVQSRRNRLHLSARERGILSCMARGASNKMIAREIDISEATVKVHVKTILRKIGVSNRTQAAIWAMSKCAPMRGGPEKEVFARPPLLSPRLRSEGAPLPLPNGHEIAAVSPAVLPMESGDKQ
jgi:two-component system nitrate/nitrite response regulator NarL